MTQEQIRDFTLRISQANPTRLVLIVMDLIDDQLEEAEKAFDRDDINQYICECKKAERYVGELIHWCNYQDKVGAIIGNHFVQIHKLLIDSRINSNCDKLPEIKERLAKLRPIYEKLEKEDKEPALMGNAQKVYAGLTYGKNSLNETSVDPGRNRGYTI